MIQRTLAQARPALSQVMGSTGMSLSDPRYIERLNQAQEEIINMGDWPGVVDRWHLLFDEISGELVLPYYLDRLLEVTVDGCPAQIMSPWAEFVNYGVGPRDDAGLSNTGTCAPGCRRWVRDCLDRGEVVTRIPIPGADGPYVIRCYASVDEDVASVSPQINLQGFLNKQVVRSLVSGVWKNGVFLDIDFSVPFTVTTETFDSLSAVVKPETNGSVRITAYNGVTEIDLSTFEPVETTPSYRNYFISRLYRATQGVRSRVVLARARRRFIPVQEDDDVLTVSNLPALKAMIQAQWKRDAGNTDEAEYYRSTAIRILQEEAKSYLGKSPLPAITYQRGYPLGAMARIQ